MSFGPNIKSELFVRCARLCCLCLKQCGIKIEVAHIVDEAKGGPSTPDNGIPLCFDCHQDIGSYNDEHPRGNKYRPNELKARRDQVYEWVESGAMFAQVVAAQQRRSRIAETQHVLQPAATPKASSEALQLTKIILAKDSQIRVLGRKFALLNPSDQAYVLDELLRHVASNDNAISAIAEIIQSAEVPDQQGLVLLEQAVRSITLLGSTFTKAELLRVIPADTLGKVEENLRIALFEDIFIIIAQDQFDEVNSLVPALVQQISALPQSLYGKFVVCLLDQARSNSYQGAPAARNALGSLPNEVGRAGLSEIDSQYLFWHSNDEALRKLASSYGELTNEAQRAMWQDLNRMSYFEFRAKYLEDPE